LHVTAVISDQVHDDTFVVCSINHPIRLEEYQAIFRHPERAQLLRHGPSQWILRKRVTELKQPIEHLISARPGIVLGDVAIDFLNLAFGVTGENDPVAH